MGPRPRLPGPPSLHLQPGQQQAPWKGGQNQQSRCLGKASIRTWTEEAMSKCFPLFLFPQARLPRETVNPQGRRQMGPCHFSSLPYPLSKAWKQRVPTHLRQWPQKWGRRLSSLSFLSVTTFSIPRISLLFFFFFNHLFSLSTMPYFCLCGPFLHLVEKLKHTYF